MQIPPIPNFLLLPNGNLPSNLKEVILLPALQLCTMDMWLGGIHRRATHMTFRCSGSKIRGQTTSTIKQRRFGAWIPDGSKNFDQYLSAGAYCVPIYTSEALICFTAAHKLTVTNQTAQFAIYPANYSLGEDAQQVVGWQNDVSPIMGTLTN